MATGPFRDWWISFLDNLGVPISGTNPLPITVVAGGSGAVDTATGVINTATPGVGNQVLLTNTIGASALSVEIVYAAATMTLQFEGSNDNANWASVNLNTVQGSPGTLTGSFQGAAATSSTWLVFGILNGLRFFRVRCSAYTGGTATVTLADGVGRGLEVPVQRVSAMPGNDVLTLPVTAFLAMQATSASQRVAGNDIGPTTTQRLATVSGSGSMTSLSAVAVTGSGLAFNLGVAHQFFGMQVTTTGAPTAISLQFEGSNDGVTWNSLGTPFTNAAGGLTQIMGFPCTRVRVTLNTLTGGIAPTVTAKLCAM